MPVALVQLGRFGSELIDVRLADRADEILEVEAVVEEVLGQCIEQFRVRGRVGDPQIVLGVDDAATEEVLEVPVHQSLGEERILRSGHPVDERLPRVLIGRDLQRHPAQPHRLHVQARSRIARRGDVPLQRDHVRHVRLGVVLAALEGDLRVERLEPVVVLLAPALERVVVALGTGQPHPQEQLGRVLHLLGRGTHLAEPGDGRMRLGFAGGGQHAADELVVRHVLAEGLANPRMEPKRVRRVGPVAAFVPQHG